MCISSSQIGICEMKSSVHVHNSERQIIGTFPDPQQTLSKKGERGYHHHTIGWARAKLSVAGIYIIGRLSSMCWAS